MSLGVEGEGSGFDSPLLFFPFFSLFIFYMNVLCAATAEETCLTVYVKGKWYGDSKQYMIKERGDGRKAWHQKPCPLEPLRR